MIENGEAKVECPYDNTHIICEKFISKHLIKCRENHKLHKKVACKFDKTHLIPKPELQFHLSICPSRYLLDRELQLKASKGVEGILCGDVKGPKIVKQYIGTNEEEWGSEPASGTPVALFNMKDMDYENDQIPGANDPSRLPRNAALASEIETCRKFPNAPSKVAQIGEMSKKPTQPGSDCQVFMYSLSQSLLNPGFGRGRGISQQQALKAVGATKSYLPDPATADYADNAGQVNVGSAGNNSHSVSRLNNSSLKQHENDLYNQQRKETLAQEYRSSVEQSKNYRPETLTTGEHLMNTPRYQDETDMPQLPKGRGKLHGVQQLRRPASSSLVQGSNLPDASRMEENSGDRIHERAQQKSIPDIDNDLTDAVERMTEELQRAERKLRKKLRQLTILEEKKAAGIQLNEEENCKLKKKAKILSLIKSISNDI